MNRVDQQSLFGDDAPAAPLAYRMRPRDLDEYVGQQHLVGPGRLLRRLIEADRLSSVIFYGPPGCGKTALAELIAARTRAAFERLNAVTSGVADIRGVLERARERRRLHRQRTVLFIDEIHRFNKAQQDALLPAVEDGTIILIGATTENPFFTVNAPLVSRSRVFRFEALGDDDVRRLLERALADQERGLAHLKPRVDDDALAHLVNVANGDARSALNALEMAVLSTEPGDDGTRHVTLAVAAEAVQRRALVYDRDGDAHYDTISAFIKSMRGSDPDATLYWLARMLEAGEDPRFIARRIVIHASEDVGLADPNALVVATAAAQAVELVGLPEARLNLAQAALYIATAPKSNSVYKGINAALRDVRERRAGPVPIHLRDASYPGAKRLGHGRGYLYPHDYPGHHVAQRYLPEDMPDVTYYEPSDQGYERRIAERLRHWRAARAGRAPDPAEGGGRRGADG